MMFSQGGARRFKGLSSVFAVAFVLVAAAPVAVAGAASSRPHAWAAADTSLGVFNVPADQSRVQSVPLTAGVTYRLVLTGTVTEAGVGGVGTTYTYDARGMVGGLLSFPSSILRVYYEGAEPAVYPFFWSLDPSTGLPGSNPTQRYEETFTAARSSRLEARVVQGFPQLVYTGGFTLELFGPAPVPVPGPSGGGSPGADKPATVLSTAKWGKPGPPAPMGPGDEAIAPGPQIGSGQTEASVAVSGDPTGLIGAIISVPKPRKKLTGGKLTGGECVRAALAFARSKVTPVNPYSGFTLRPEPTAEQKSLFDDTALATILFLSACLEYVREVDKQANAAALRPAVGAARLSCGVRTASLSVRVDRAANRISYRSRRASRRGPARGLRVSCRKARNGTVTMRIRTRSRRTKLRKVLGKRLVVGLYRPRAATGTANVQTTFKRR